MGWRLLIIFVKIVVVGSFQLQRRFWDRCLSNWYIEKSTEFIPKSEIFTNYKLPWLQNDGCIEESFEAAVSERLMLLLEELENR